LTYIGPKVESILGYSQESWAALGFWEAHLDPRDRERILRESKLSISQTDQFELEYRVVASNGAALWFRDGVRVARLDRVLLEDIGPRRLVPEPGRHCS
jgi:PAS domain-containing protein